MLLPVKFLALQRLLTSSYSFFGSSTD